MVDSGCSGTLISPQLVLYAAHCATKLQAGCERFTYDQKKTFATDSRFGYKVVVPPAGSANMLHPQLVSTASTAFRSTYSFRDGKLWVLDESLTANTRRLIRIAPFLGHAEVVYTFTKSAAYTKQWFVLDVDGNVVLASSGTSNFGIARFQSAGLHGAIAPTVSKLEQGAGQLMTAPVIDSKGNTIVRRAAAGVPLTTERRTSLQGSGSTLAGLDAIL